MSRPLQPRKAVRDMAPYSPPTSGRADKLRLDFHVEAAGRLEQAQQQLAERDIF